MPSSKLVSILLAASLALTACGGPTEQSIIDQYQSAFDQKREDLKTIAALLPPKGQVVEENACPALDPVPALGFNAPYNTGMLMEEQLLDPYADVSYYLSDYSEFIVPFERTDAQYEQWQRESEAEDNYAQIFEDVLGYKYLIVNRVTHYVEPEVIDSSNYYLGEMGLDGFIFSLEDKTLLCNYHVDALSDTDLEYTYEQGSSGIQEASDAAWESLQSNTTKALIQKLTELTGGDFYIW